MIRVFFNVRLDEATLPERRGQWVADAEEARAVARTIVRRLVQQHGGEPRLLDAAMVVTDEAGACLLDLSFFEALYVPVDAPAPVPAPRREGAPAGGRFAALVRSVPQGLRALAGMRVPGRADLARGWAALRDALREVRLSARRDPRARYRLGFESGR